MFTRPAQTAYVCAALLALPAFTAMAQEQPTQAGTPPAAIAQRADTPDIEIDHVAAAKRFQQEAERYEKEAAKHEHEAAEYRRLAPRAPKGANYPEMAKHCDRLAQKLKAAAAEARAIAEMHGAAATVIGK